MSVQRPHADVLVHAAGHQQFEPVHVLDVRHGLLVRAVRVDQQRSGRVLGGRALGAADEQRVQQVREAQTERLLARGGRGPRAPERGHVPRLDVAVAEAGEQVLVARVRRHARHVVPAYVRGRELRLVLGVFVRAPQVHRAVARGYQQIADVHGLGPGVQVVRRECHAALDGRIRDAAARFRAHHAFGLCHRALEDDLEQVRRRHHHIRPRICEYGQHVLLVCET